MTQKLPETLSDFRKLACCQPAFSETYIKPTPEEVACLIRLAEWSQKEVAMLTGVKSNKKGSAIVRKWRTQKDSPEYRSIPYAAWRLLLMAAGVVESSTDIGHIKRLRAIHKADAIYYIHPLVLDTETTGLAEKDQIIEIAICDREGRGLFESRVKPTVEIEQEAEDIHHISMKDLDSAPQWPDIEVDVKKLLESNHLIIFNSEYDLRMLKQTAAAFNSDTTWIDNLQTTCAMYLAADVFGATNKYGSISLANAMKAANVSWRGEAHSALADAQGTADVFKTIAELTEKEVH